MEIEVGTTVTRVVTCAACSFQVAAVETDTLERAAAYEDIAVHGVRCEDDALMERLDGAIQFFGISDWLDQVVEFLPAVALVVSRTGACDLGWWDLDDYEDDYDE